MLFVFSFFLLEFVVVCALLGDFGFLSWLFCCCLFLGFCTMIFVYVFLLVLGALFRLLVGLAFSRSHMELSCASFAIEHI